MGRTWLGGMQRWVDCRRFWQRRIGKAVVMVAVAAPLLLIAGSLVAARATESNQFCGTDCHEMWPYRDAWEASAHSETDCVECHIPPGAVNFALTKMYASREVWIHFTGQVKAPIRVTRHIPDSACLRSGCHTDAEIAKKIKLGDPAPAPFDHGSTGHPDQQCIECHAGLAHQGAPGVDVPPPNSMLVVLHLPHRRSDGLRLLSQGAPR